MEGKKNQEKKKRRRSVMPQYPLNFIMESSGEKEKKKRGIDRRIFEPCAAVEAGRGGGKKKKK